ncbi:MAG: acyltransferase [Acidimicrobiia bacterium]|nr:acyltransferase [Acidimicrobiia bacterium]
MAASVPARSLLGSARAVAERTPVERNRYVDFLRAVSILAVVIGHWLVITPWVSADGVFHGDHLLTRSELGRWLTWLFQVMPVFFAVGGFANAVSWDSATKRGTPYGDWLVARLRRLVLPALPLLALWAGFAIATWSGVMGPMLVEVTSLGALSPLWFLAVYVAVVALVPLTRKAWLRFGVWSFWAPVLATVVVDIAAFGFGVTWLRWINYAFVWPAVHQLGYLWRDGRLGGARSSAPYAIGGLGVALVAVLLLDYPVAMIGVPGADVSNSAPPTVAMLALGIGQFGILLAAERPMRRWLDKVGPWTATVLVNGMIMTLFVWHYTVMVVPVVADAAWLDGFGMRLEPDTGPWWATRPLWIAVLVILMALFAPLVGRFERPGGRDPTSTGKTRPIAGTVLACAGFAGVALVGVSTTPDLSWVALALPAIGMGVAGAMGRAGRSML